MKDFLSLIGYLVAIALIVIIIPGAALLIAWIMFRLMQLWMQVFEHIGLL